MSDQSKGKVIVLTAPSGAGKSTIARMLLDEFDRIVFSTSATTRDARKGEQNGREYYFLSDNEFDRKIEEGDFLEWEEFYENTRYGTLRSEVDKQLESGYYVLLDIEVKGAGNIKRIYGDQCLTIFIRPPSIDVLKERLTNRGSESDETLKLRLERAAMEVGMADRFDKVIINDDLEDAYEDTRKIVTEFMNAH